MLTSEHSAPHTEFLDPATAETMELNQLLDAAARKSDRFSGLTRIGRILTDDGNEFGHPFCLPLLGEGHVAIIEPKAAEVTEVTNGILGNLLAETVATQPHRSVHVTVTSNARRGQEFSSPLALLNNQYDDDRYLFVPNNNIKAVIAEVAADLRQRQQYNMMFFDGYETLRESVESGNQPLAPWRVVVLDGRGAEALDETAWEQLAEITDSGIHYGISLISCGGVELPATSPNPIARLRIVSRRWVDMVDMPGIRVFLDTPPQKEHFLEAIEQSESRDIKPGKSLRGGRYVHLVLQGMNRAVEEQAALQMLIESTPKEFPYLDPAFLKRWIADSREHSQALSVVFGPAAHIGRAEAVTDRLLKVGEKPNMTTPKLITWATYQLALASQPTEDRQITEDTTKLARNLLEQHLPHLNSLAKLIVDPSSLIGPAGQRIADLLPAEPPAWLFQLLADAAFPESGFLPGKLFAEHEGRFMEPQHQASETVIEYLIKKFYPEDYKPGKRPSTLHPARTPSLRNALIELALLDLYKFTDEKTPNELCDALAWRANRRLAKVTAEELPEDVRIMHDIINSYLLSKKSAYEITKMS